jgi:formate dehydrogenase subunit gamma
MMRHILCLLVLLLAAPAFGQAPPAPVTAPVGGTTGTMTGGRPAGTPEVQAPVPEVGAGRGSGPNTQVPNSTEPSAPTGTPVAPMRTAPAAAPTIATPAPTPLSDRNQLSAEEQELQSALQGTRIQGRISIPDRTAASLIQPEGQDWRLFHNRTLAWVGGIAVLGALGLIVLFYLTVGRIRIDAGFAGRTIERFGLLERANHWMTASCFIILMLSGLNLTFGRYLLLPLLGPEGFTELSMLGKVAHNYLAFPFTLGIVVMLLLWVKDNIPKASDLAWLKAAGGFFGHTHPPAGRFNAGQKAIFWITVGGGAIVAGSGYVLVFPFTVTDIAGQQLSHMLHGVLAMLMMAAMLGHIYIGTLGMEGGFAAMGSGKVDYNWAREHHSLWVEEEVAKARETLSPGSARAAGAD